MISYVKKTDMYSVAKDAEDNRFEQIRRQQPKGAGDRTLTARRARQTAANNRLL